MIIAGIQKLVTSLVITKIGGVHYCNSNRSWEVFKTHSFSKSSLVTQRLLILVRYGLVVVSADDKMPRLFKRSHRYNVAKNCFLARIILLDNTTIEFNLLPEVTGSDCLEKVAQVLVIQEVSPRAQRVVRGDTHVCEICASGKRSSYINCRFTACWLSSFVVSDCWS